MVMEVISGEDDNPLKVSRTWSSLIFVYLKIVNRLPAAISNLEKQILANAGLGL